MRITTTAHVMALGLYVLMCIIGASWAADAAPMINAVRLYGPWASAILGLPIAAAAFLGFLAALTSRWFRQPAGALRIEAVSCAVCAAGFALYWVSIFGKAVTTELLMMGLVVICLARILQIAVELRHISHADR